MGVESIVYTFLLIMSRITLINTIISVLYIFFGGIPKRSIWDIAKIMSLKQRFI